MCTYATGTSPRSLWNHPVCTWCTTYNITRGTTSERTRVTIYAALGSRAQMCCIGNNVTQVATLCGVRIDKRNSVLEKAGGERQS